MLIHTTNGGSINYEIKTVDITAYNLYYDYRRFEVFKTKII